MTGHITTLTAQAKVDDLIRTAADARRSHAARRDRPSRLRRLVPRLGAPTRWTLTPSPNSRG